MGPMPLPLPLPLPLLLLPWLPPPPLVFRWHFINISVRSISVVFELCFSSISVVFQLHVSGI